MAEEIEKQVTLDNLSGGVANELFEGELAKVVADILDLNTEAEAVREIKLIVKIKPEEDRARGSVSMSIASKLGPRKGVGTVMFFGRRAGRNLAVEAPKQANLFKTPTGSVVNLATGEEVKP